MIGSVPAALYAGMNAANSETVSNTKKAAMNVAGSFGANPKSSAFAKRVVKIAATIPMPLPMITIAAES